MKVLLWLQHTTCMECTWEQQSESSPPPFSPGLHSSSCEYLPNCLAGAALTKMTVFFSPCYLLVWTEVLFHDFWNLLESFSNVRLKPPCLSVRLPWTVREAPGYMSQDDRVVDFFVQPNICTHVGFLPWKFVENRSFREPVFALQIVYCLSSEPLYPLQYRHSQSVKVMWDRSCRGELHNL